ncbi:hypothetical protein KOW79_002360 [Hemibagrus wyckioides]|uniref:Uncharacterized protein n=1 Tax=Hemibagrus wyckioides TaxID=337641 RepID=A0A9D3P3G0_9TELE|nr:uncharacterized protein si:ch211-217g15.3 [Hemibagrus wyckioides]KAG7333953.1 hypothetical protein KOW79_002360 [Hemibagrus wyckioides]
MFRCSVLLCLLVMLYSTTSSPYKSWEKEKYTAVQDTRAHDINEKIMLGLKEVEPVKEQDLTEVDVDPHMAIWKAMKQFRQQKDKKPKEDKDSLPSDFQHSAGNEQAEAYLEPQYYRHGRLYQEAEKDMDDVYHNIQGLQNHDDIKEGVVQPEIPVPDKAEVMELRETNVYLTPEEDLDGLYHEDFTGQVFQVPVIFPKDPPKKVYSEPEEDQDHLFHS